MQAPKKLKIIIDILMTVSLLLSMSYLLIGQRVHEYVGTLLLALFATHNVLNRKWYKNFPKNNFTGAPIFQTSVNVLTIISTLGAIISGIILSQNVFGFVSISGFTAYARTLHLLAVYWAFAFISMHIGLHWGMIYGLTKRGLGNKKLNNKVIWTLRFFGFLVVLAGVRAFIKHNIYSYMFLRTQFVFFDMDESRLLFFGEYIAMMASWGFIAHNLKNLTNKIRFIAHAET
jgi:hypothetical protein